MSHQSGLSAAPANAVPGGAQRDGGGDVRRGAAHHGFRGHEYGSPWSRPLLIASTAEGKMMHADRLSSGGDQHDDQLIMMF